MEELIEAKNILNVEQQKIMRNLSLHHGSENAYPHQLFRSCTYTDGVRYLIESCKCWWLVNDIIVYCNMKLQKEEYISITLKVNGNTAMLTYDDGNENILHQEPISFTDFCLPEIQLTFENKTLFLPSER